MKDQAKKEEKKEPLAFTDDYYNSLNIGEWVKLMTSGHNYSPRTGHECIYYKQKLYLFGGTDSDDRKNDLYQYDIYTNKWSKMIHQGTIPLPRSGSKGAAYKDCLYFFGGYQKQSGDYYNDFFFYDLSRKRWQSIELEGEYPS